MVLKHFINKGDNLKASLKLYQLICLMTTIGMMYSVYVAHSSAINARTIIMPPIVDSRIEITGIEADDDFYKLWTKYCLSLFFNYTPETFDDQALDLVKAAHPVFRDSLRAKLAEMSDQIKELHISSMYYPVEFKIDRQNKQIIIDGKRWQKANGIEIENDRKTYIMKFEMDNGRFQINGIHEQADQ